jgi:protein tyrosine/serine phosphatase
MLSLTGTCNTRSLGGIRNKENKKIKEKMLYRSDELSLLTAEDWEILREIGIGTICDLRRRDEAELYPTNIPEGMEIKKLWWDFGDENLSERFNRKDESRISATPRDGRRGAE